MKTYGLIETQTFLSIITDGDNNPRLDTICPRGQYYMDDPSAPWNGPGALPYNSIEYPNLLWTPPAMVELIKLPYPDINSNQTVDPKLIWTETNVTRDWTIRDMTPTELADSLRKTWLTSQAFLSEFTMIEVGSIGISVDPTIAALRLILSTWVGQIYSDDPRVILGLDAIEAAGIISAARRAEIIAKS